MDKKTVLITGSAKGIGRQIALNFAKLGYNVCVNYNSSKKEAIDLKEQIANINGSVEIYQADISSEEQVINMCDFFISKFGKIDVLINNAGICQYKLFTDISTKDLKSMIDVSLIGMFNVTKYVVKKSMLSLKKGSIINISSIWGVTGASCETHYSMVKAGIIGFTKALAKELSTSNIRVNSVSPGVIETDMIKGFSKEELLELKNEIPLNRFGTTQDVANVIKFLASDDSSYITGQNIGINGGLVI